MTRPAPRRDARGGWLLLLALAGQVIFFSWLSPRVQAADKKARQVTICGIVATPQSTAIDPRLAKIEPQLRKLLPNCGFKLLDVQTKSLRPGQSVACNLQGGGYTAEALLIEPRDENGKVRIRCQLSLNMIVQLETLVKTPPNQLFFCDQALSNGDHLLIGIGAR